MRKIETVTPQDLLSPTKRKWNMAHHIQNHDKLLSDIQLGLREIPDDTPIGSIRVSFLAGDNEYEGTLLWALDCLSNDLYWDERGDWSGTTEAKVTTW